MTSGFEHLPHTADSTVHAWGPTLADALAEACRGFTDVVTEVAPLEPHIEHSVSIIASSKEALLYDLMTELIVLKDTKGFVPCAASFRIRQEHAKWALTGTLRGDHVSKYETHGDVKAMTYHALRVIEGPVRSSVTFTVDI